MHRLLRALALGFVFMFAVSPAFPAEVRVLNDVKEAINANLRLFSGGPGKTFYGSVHDFIGDQAGLTRLALLRDAARRGNQVYLTIDDFASHLDPAFIEYLDGEGVHIRVFNKQKIHNPKTWFNRSHEKVWTDGESAIITDMNEGDLYWGENTEKRSKSLSMFIHGPQAKDAFDHEQRLFSSDYVGPLTKKKSTSAELEAAKAKIDDAAKRLPKLLRIPEDEWQRGIQKVDDDKLRFVHDEPHTKGTAAADGVEAHVLRMIEQAKPGEKVFIVAPYMVFPKNYMTTMREARKRGVEIQLLTNSWESTDQFLAHLGYVAERELLQRMGIQTQEYWGKQLLHAKGGVVYTAGENPVPREAYLGSFQPHMRGALLDLETVAITSDPALAGRIAEGLQSALDKSLPAPETAAGKADAAVNCILQRLLSIGIAPIRKQL